MTDHSSGSSKPKETRTDPTVAVTGGSGKLGRAVVAALIEEGWAVVNFDRVPSPDSRVRFIRTDLTDYGQVVEALSGIDEVHSGVDAVVHLAAIPGATFAPNVATFDDNLVSTFHVFQAAKLFKIHNLVWASSETLLGYPFNNAPAYVPLDESVPPTPEVVYALAKDLEEEMARQYCRWNPDQKMIGLRFSNVIDPPEYANFPSFENDPAARKWNLWSYIDARDGAQAVVRALEYDKPGFDNFVIANADTVMSRPSKELMADFFPETEFRAAVEGNPVTLLHRESPPSSRLEASALMARTRIDMTSGCESTSDRSEPRRVHATQPNKGLDNTCPSQLVPQTTPPPPRRDASRLDRPGRWRSDRLHPLRHLAGEVEDGAVDPRCAADRVRVAQGCAHAGGRRLPSRRTRLPRRWGFH
jgi:nucleoside-diphosphate-sugar epimerase